MAQILPAWKTGCLNTGKQEFRFISVLNLSLRTWCCEYLLLHLASWGCCCCNFMQLEPARVTTEKETTFPCLFPLVLITEHWTLFPSASAAVTLNTINSLFFWLEGGSWHTSHIFFLEPSLHSIPTGQALSRSPKASGKGSAQGCDAERGETLIWPDQAAPVSFPSVLMISATQLEKALPEGSSVLPKGSLSLGRKAGMACCNQGLKSVEGQTDSVTGDDAIGHCCRDLAAAPMQETSPGWSLDAASLCLTLRKPAGDASRLSKKTLQAPVMHHGSHSLLCSNRRSALV